MLNKVAVLILTGLLGAFLSSGAQAEPPAGQASPSAVPTVVAQPQTIPAQTILEKKASSGFQLFNLKFPNLAPKNKAEKYRLCAKRKGICKCQKTTDEPGILTVMDPSRCTPPPPPVVQALPLEDKKSIQKMQRLLKKAGYKPGPADGSMGPKTKTAIELYQSNAGLQPDGIPTIPLLETLSTEIANAEESKRQAELAALANALVDPKVQMIKGVQSKLNHLGFKAGEADGQMGSKITAAIRQFQTKNNMPADGKINDKVLQRLSDLAPDSVSQPIYAGASAPVPNGSASAETITPPPANPLAKLFSGLASTSTKNSLPNSMEGYRNCALRSKKCVCQALTDDPGVWTTMQHQVCTKRSPRTGEGANLIAPKPSVAPAAKPIARVAGNTISGNTYIEQKTSGSAPTAKAAGSSFFDSIAKVLTPGK